MQFSYRCLLLTGTGKTFTGINIAHLYHMLNKTRRDDAEGKIMYCGASNSSVDVALSKWCYWSPILLVKKECDSESGRLRVSIVVLYVKHIFWLFRSVIQQVRQKVARDDSNLRENAGESGGF